jgi:hypothetical protein
MCPHKESASPPDGSHFNAQLLGGCVAQRESQGFRTATMNTTYCNSTDESSSEEGDGNLPLSIVLTVAGSAVLAFSMTTQRYGLAHPDQYISLFGCRWHRLLVYFMGLVLYGAANGLKVVGFSFGPFSVLGSVFSLVLVFNLLFARWLLREQITTPKIASSATILLGAILCTIGAPANVQTVFTPSDISTLVRPPSRTHLDHGVCPL